MRRIARRLDRDWPPIGIGGQRALGHQLVEDGVEKL